MHAALELCLGEEGQELGPALYDATRQEGVSPALSPRPQPGGDPAPLGLAVVETDPARLADISPADAGSLSDPQTVTGTEDSQGEHGQVRFGPYCRGNCPEHAEGSPNLLARLGVVCPPSPSCDGLVDGAHRGPQKLELFGHANCRYGAAQSCGGLTHGRQVCQVPCKGVRTRQLCIQDPARPTPLSSLAQAKTVLSALRRSARARGSVAKSAAHRS